MKNNQYCVIMAGGIGSRFWPMSRDARPKQFLDILGNGKSFLQETFERFVKIIPPENILIVTGANYARLVQEHLPQLRPEQILAEPIRRNTAPCIAYAAYKIFSQNPDATMVVAPSDHYIDHEDEFLQLIGDGLNFAAGHHSLITLGITPIRPETNYGYIQINRADEQRSGSHRVFRVKTFTEKPNADLARVFMDSGEFLWNSGIFLWNVQTICKALTQHLPDVAALFEKGLGLYNTPAEASFIADTYAQCTAISIDYGVMEKAQNVFCYAGDFGWSDLGTWISLYAHKDKDPQGNVVVAGESMLYEVSNSMVECGNPQKLLVLRGLDNYMVIDSDDVLLVCPKDDEQFKELLKDIPVKKKAAYL